MTERLKLIVSLVTLTLLLIVSYGCEEQQMVDSRIELVQPQLLTDSKLATRWVAEYGSDIMSVEHFNLALTRLVLEQQAKSIVEMKKELNDVKIRLVYLEALQGIFVDPNQGDK